MRRVVVTGIGLLTPLGAGREATWDALIAGKTAVGPIRHFDPASLSTKVGAELEGFEPKDYVTNRRSLRMMTHNDQLAVAGAALAVRDSGIDLTEEVAEDCALFVGSNKELCDPVRLVEPTLAARNDDGSVDIHRLGETASSTFYPLFYVEGLQAASLFFVSEAFGLKGANTYFAGTAETGAVAIGRAYRAIRRGEADTAIAGGFDDPVSWYTMSKFDAFGVLTVRNELGGEACRPWDEDRDGTVFGEGSAFLVLEEYDQAKKRGAEMYAEVTGFGSSFDTAGLLTPNPEGTPLVRAIEAARREAASAPQGRAYVAAHAGGTRLGDASEARALRAAFDSNGAVEASSIKGATGDLIAGAGALNAAVAALALHHRTAPPTLNLRKADPACEGLDLVQGEARESDADEAFAIARGLEGQNVALAMRAIR
jgi:3-oxoacyl-[acyl-carrier-protein] synthase II